MLNELSTKGGRSQGLRPGSGLAKSVRFNVPGTRATAPAFVAEVPRVTETAQFGGGAGSHLIGNQQQRQTLQLSKDAYTESLRAEGSRLHGIVPRHTAGTLNARMQSRDSYVDSYKLDTYIDAFFNDRVRPYQSLYESDNTARDDLRRQYGMSTQRSMMAFAAPAEHLADLNRSLADSEMLAPQQQANANAVPNAVPLANVDGNAGMMQAINDYFQNAPRANRPPVQLPNDL